MPQSRPIQQSNRKPSPPKRTARRSSRPASKRVECRGVLELHPKGYGFLRDESGLTRNKDDTYVSSDMIKRHQLLPGSFIHGSATANSKLGGPRLSRIETIDGWDLESSQNRLPFDERLSINPTRRIDLEHEQQPVSMRVLDLLCPIGFGQRALIAAPPRVGKTTLLKEIGKSISLNHPNVKLMILLIDERPEEVTELTLEMNGLVYASCLDQQPQNHARLAKLVLERCKRLAETGEDVVLLVDSLTRLSRACNKLPNLSGPTGAGGLNIRALDLPKKLFGSARAFQCSGSLTIVATTLIETDNRMDEIIFREFKGTGNLDIVLNRQLADQRIFPAINVEETATRRVELLQSPQTLDTATALRNRIMRLGRSEGMKLLVDNLSRFPTNHALVQLVRGQNE